MDKKTERPLQRVLDGLRVATVVDPSSPHPDSIAHVIYLDAITSKGVHVKGLEAEARYELPSVPRLRKFLKTCSVPAELRGQALVWSLTPQGGNREMQGIRRTLHQMLGELDEQYYICLKVPYDFPARYLGVLFNEIRRRAGEVRQIYGRTHKDYHKFVKEVFRDASKIKNQVRRAIFLEEKFVQEGDYYSVGMPGSRILEIKQRANERVGKRNRASSIKTTNNRFLPEFYGDLIGYATNRLGIDPSQTRHTLVKGIIKDLKQDYLSDLEDSGDIQKLTYADIDEMLPSLHAIRKRMTISTEESSL